MGVDKSIVFAPFECKRLLNCAHCFHRTPVNVDSVEWRDGRTKYGQWSVVCPAAVADLLYNERVVSVPIGFHRRMVNQLPINTPALIGTDSVGSYCCKGSKEWAQKVK